MTFNLDALCEELNLQELAELVPTEAHKEKLVIWTLQLYSSDLGFSKELKKFIESRGIPIGAALSKGSPIHLQKTPQPQEQSNMAKEPEVQPNMTLAGALAYVIPELVEVLEKDATATLHWDGETLALGDAKPKKSTKGKEEPKEEPKGKGKPEPKKEEPKGKGKGKEEPEPEEETMTEEEFDVMLEDDLKDTDALAEFAESMEVEWEKHKVEKINRMRIIKAIRAACGWSEGK